MPSLRDMHMHLDAASVLDCVHRMFFHSFLATENNPGTLGIPLQSLCTP